MGVGPVCWTSLPTGLSEWELGPRHVERSPITNFFSLLPLRFSLLSLNFDTLIMCLRVGLCIHLVWESPHFLDLYVYSHHLVRKVFCYCFPIGDPSAWHGPSSHSERPVESEVQHTRPTPTDRFSRGESGLHCT